MLDYAVKKVVGWNWNWNSDENGLSSIVPKHQAMRE